MVKMFIETKVGEMNSSLELVAGLWRSLDAFFSRWQAAKHMNVAGEMENKASTESRFICMLNNKTTKSGTMMSKEQF